MTDKVTRNNNNLFTIIYTVNIKVLFKIFKKFVTKKSTKFYTIQF